MNKYAIAPAKGKVRTMNNHASETPIGNRRMTTRTESRSRIVKSVTKTQTVHQLTFSK